MILYNIYALVLFAVKSVNSYQTYAGAKFNAWYNARDAPERILQLMRTYYEEAHIRVIEMNYIRFTYEDSPHYEQGYIMGEIIERYSRVVEHNQRMTMFRADIVFDNLRRLESIQKEYFEIYHLVRMMHEIPQKYKNTLEFKAGTKGEHQMSIHDMQKMEKTLADMEKRRLKEKKKRMKMNAEMRQAYLKGVKQADYGKKRTPYNKWWPIDYGWEVDYFWNQKERN